MRELDRNTVYFDTYGNPLKGRVFFYTKGTTTKQSIFNVDGSARANPVFTSNGKIDPQVFLDDKDYTIVWQSYQGNGTMAEDEEETSWSFAGSCVSLQPSVSFEITNYGIVNVETVSDLRGLDTEQLHDGEIVTLLGYNAAGDKPSVNYRWNAESTASDNSGSVIKADDSALGRFEIVPADVMDVRHFGVFPAEELADLDSTQKMRLVTAHQYAVSKNITIFLPNADGATAYYLLSSITYNHLKAQDNNVRLVAENGTVSAVKVLDGCEVYVINNENYGGKVTIYGNDLKASFNVNQSTNVSFTPLKSFVVDVATQTGCPATFTNISVEFIVDSSKGYTFKNCKIVSNKHLASNFSYTFNDCEFTDRYFVSNAPMFSVLTISDCSVNIDDFENAVNWYDASVANGSTDFDFSGREIGEIEIVSNGSIVNAHFTDVVSFTRGVTSIKFTRCSFTSRLYGVDSMEFFDCDLYNIGTADDIVKNAVVMNCSASFGVYVNSLTASNSVFNAAVNLYSVNTGTQYVKLNGNTFGSAFNMNKGAGVSVPTFVNGYIINNYFGQTPSCNSDVYSALSSVVCENNGGSFPSNRVVKKNSMQSVSPTTSDMGWQGWIAALDSVSFFGFGKKKVAVKVSGVRQQGNLEQTIYQASFPIVAFKVFEVEMNGHVTISLGTFNMMFGDTSTPYPEVLIEAEIA